MLMQPPTMDRAADTSDHQSLMRKRSCAHGTLTIWLAVGTVVLVFLWNYGIAFRGDIYGFYRIGTVLPHSPYIQPSEAVLATGELGYDGQLFLSIALDPRLTNHDTLAALDNPRYRYRRILFPVLGYLTAGGLHTVVPYALVFINAIGLIALVALAGRWLQLRGKPVWPALFVLGVPGLWCAFLLTTSDILASLLLVLALLAAVKERYGLLALCYALAALTHETMLVVVGTLAIPVVVRKQWRNSLVILVGALPAIIWNIFVLYAIPADGSTSGILENFAWPGAGILNKIQTIASDPISLKWIYDTTAFFLLCSTFGLLTLRLHRHQQRHVLLPCLCGYWFFLLLSRMQILSYYIDFLRVFGNVALLAVLALDYQRWRTINGGLLWAWAAMSVAFVCAYSLRLI